MSDAILPCLKDHAWQSRGLATCSALCAGDAAPLVAFGYDHPEAFEFIPRRCSRRWSAWLNNSDTGPVNFVPGITLMFLLVPTAIAAAIVGWLALRPTPPNWIALAGAYAILLSPFVLATVWWSDEGFQLAVAIAFFTVVTPIVAVALTAGVVYKRGRAK